MSALVPVLAVVLAAELGGALRGLGATTRPGMLALAAGLLVSVAAGGGAFVGAAMTPWARLLLVGLVLIFAGAARFGAARKPPMGLVAALATLWRASAAFAAFAFAAWLGDPFGAAIGALLGLAAAVLLPLALPRAAGLALGAILCGFGAIASLTALRVL